MDDKPKYNPQIHHRKSIRLKEYNYSNPGTYFITICTHNREHLFGYIRAGVNPAPTEMVLNNFGQIANDEWANLKNRFTNIELGEFVIMPNHMHGIISIVDNHFNNNTNDTNLPMGNIVGAYKSLVANKCLKSFLQSLNIGTGVNPVPTMGKIWQRNYYEHIIRDDESYNKIANYIINNPANWNSDKFYG